MWNTCKGKRTGPSFPSSSHLLSGRDLQIPPLERVWQLHNGAACSRSDGRPPGNPFSPLPTRPEVHPRQVGRGRRCPRASAAFAPGQRPAPVPTRAPGHGRPAAPAASVHEQRAAGSRRPRPRIAARVRRAGEIRPPGLPRGAIWPGQPQPARASRGTADPGSSCFPAGPLPAAPRSGHGGRASVRANAPRLPRRCSAGEALRAARRPHLPASARRAHTGAHAPAHSLTRAAHSRRLRPHPCAKEPRDPSTPQGPHPVHRPPVPLLGCPSTSPPRLGAAGAASPPIPEAHPAGVPQHRAGTARPVPTRGREEGAAPQRGLAPRIGDWGTLPTHPPITSTLPAAQKVADGTAVPVQPTGGPQLRRLRRSGAAEPETRAGEAQGCGAEVWAEATSGYPLLSHRARRQLPPGAGPASSSSSARPPPPPGCGGAARPSALGPPPAPGSDTRRRADLRGKGAKRPEEVGEGGGEGVLTKEEGRRSPNTPSPSKPRTPTEQLQLESLATLRSHQLTKWCGDVCHL